MTKGRIEEIREEEASRKRIYEQVEQYLNKLHGDNQFRIVVFNGSKVLYPVIPQQEANFAVADLTQYHLVLIDLVKKTVAATEEVTQDLYRFNDKDGALDEFSFKSMDESEIANMVRDIARSLLKTKAKRQFSASPNKSSLLLKDKEAKKSRSKSPYLFTPTIVDEKNDEVPRWMLKSSPDQMFEEGKSDAVNRMQKAHKEMREKDLERLKEENRTQKRERLADDFTKRDEVEERTAQDLGLAPF